MQVAPTTNSSFRAGNDVYRVARMQKPQHVMQFDLGRVQTHDLAANATELRPIALSARATTIDHDSRSGGAPSEMKVRQ